MAQDLLQPGCRWIKVSGTVIYVTDGKYLTQGEREPNDSQFGLPADTMKEYGRRRQATAIAQFYTLVNNGLIMAKHIFQGVERDLYSDDDIDADKQKLVYTWKPVSDYIWTGGANGHPDRVKAPEDSIFAVLISPNHKHRDQYPMISGWIERWNWISEDAYLSEAPINWVDRYNNKLWSRK